MTTLDAIFGYSEQYIVLGLGLSASATHNGLDYYISFEFLIGIDKWLLFGLAVAIVAIAAIVALITTYFAPVVAPVIASVVSSVSSLTASSTSLIAAITYIVQSMQTACVS